MSDSTEPELSDPWKLCVPKPARAAVLRECHDNPTAGHLGIAKTTARLALRYYWPGMFPETAQYVRNCPSCLRYKTPQQQLPGKMYPTPNRQPWETVRTDLVSPLPRSSRGNCYVVVMQDRFTKWVQCRAVRKATARAVTQALYEEVITRFGCPVTVISDNGTQYSGGTFRTLLQELGIVHRLTPPYTPQANPVETTNKTLKIMVAQFCKADQKKWDARLPEMMFALNTSRYESTRYTPALLNFGRELVAPNARHPKMPPADEVKEADDAVHHSETFVTGSRVVTRETAFSNGTTLCHPVPKGFAAKLAPKYSGPYTVTKVPSPVVYNLQSPSGQRILRAHIKDLKPYRVAEPPIDCANIYRMPNPRAPPAPADLPSANQQLRRRQAGQGELAQAARRAAQQLQQRFRRAPQTPQEGKRRTRTRKNVRNAPAPPRTSPTPVGPTASGETPSLPQTRPAASIPDRRLGQAGPPSADRGTTGAWDSARPHRPQPTTWSNAAAAAAPCSRQEPRPQQQQHATDRPAGRAAHGQPVQTHPAAGGPPPENDHRPNGNDGSRHNSAAASGVCPARPSAHAIDDQFAGRPTVPRRDASPTAPTPEGEANPHGETYPPICPARRDTSGLEAKTNPLPGLIHGSGTSNTPAGQRKVQCSTRDVVSKNFLLVVRPPNPAPVRRDRSPPPGLYQVCAIQSREHIRRTPPPPPQ
jgi:transposase InsO family protein